MTRDAFAPLTILLGTALLAWGQATPAPSQRYAEVVLAVDGMV